MIGAFSGIATACVILALFVALTPESYPEAEKLKASGEPHIVSMVDAALAGDAESQFQLGRILETGSAVAEPSFAESLQWYLKASKQGHEAAQISASALYLMGAGTRKDVGKARHWLERSANSGNLEARKFLAVLYLGKEGFPLDEKRATEWLTKAAESGDGESQFNLSVAYQKGTGVEPSLKETQFWLHRSAENGYAPAARLLQMQAERQTGQSNYGQLRQRQQQQPYRPLGSGASPFAPQNPSTYVPPQFREAQRRAERATR